jgi:hypothetical protein
MPRLLQRDHPVAAPRQHCRGGAAGRASADDRHVTLLERRRSDWSCHVPSLVRHSAAGSGPVSTGRHPRRICPVPELSLFSLSKTRKSAPIAAVSRLVSTPTEGGRIPTCQRNKHCKERVVTDERAKPPVPRQENSFASRSITSAKASTGLARPSRRSPSAYRRHAGPESIYLRRPKGRLPRRRARPQPEPMPWVTGHRPEGRRRRNGRALRKRRSNAKGAARPVTGRSRPRHAALPAHARRASARERR